MNATAGTSIIWEQFFNTEVKQIIADIKRRLPPYFAHEAEDIIYRSVEETAQMREPVDSLSKLKNLVYQRAKWRLVDLIRNRKTQQRSCEGLSQKEKFRELTLLRGRGYHHEHLSKDFWEYWESAIQGLEPQDRELVTGRYVHGESRQVLAEKHGMLPATVGTRICRAMKRVRDYLEANHIGPDFFYC